MQEAKKIKLGAFLLLSISLFILSLISTGIHKVFEDKIQAITAVKTSVDGLSIGAPVKYLGMTVGKITKMTMHTQYGGIIIYFTINAQAFEDEFADKKAFWNKMSALTIKDLVEKNTLRCYVNASGIMGGAYLELKTIKDIDKKELVDKEIAVNSIKIPANTTYIPSIPSHIGNAIQNVSRVLEDLKNVQWDSLSNNINTALTNINSTLSNQELLQTLLSLKNLGIQLEKTAIQMEKVFNDQNVDKINKAIEGVDKSVNELAHIMSKKEFVKTLNNFNNFMVEGVRVLKDTENKASTSTVAISNYALRLENSLVRMENILNEILHKTNNLSKDPAQFVRGRQEKPLLK
jgi:ABC-type transporter Mla subunit MlaD